MGRHSATARPGLLGLRRPAEPAANPTRRAENRAPLLLSTQPIPLAPQADAAEVDELPGVPYRPIAVRGTIAAEPSPLSAPSVWARALQTGPIPTVGRAARN